ncbi:MAG: NADH:flavin oxidoreductase [Candidatus Brocadiaceae bacterium]|nr:NADH:flavin oxidoreductase [Candidatus Brocadiaceae bacterium]
MADGREAPKIRRVASLTTPDEFRRHVAGLGIELPLDDAAESGDGAPLAQPWRLPNGRIIGNRWCIHPMEGWDCAADGRPTELVHRRWRHFGRSGAKLIWGGEAAAVRHDGRANPRQLVINDDTVGDVAALRTALVDEHRAAYGRTDDLLVGLQLTHSGRFCKPNADDRPEPRIACHHPVLDRRLGIPPDAPVLSDTEIEDIAACMVHAAGLAHRAGFDFVDVKHCHGYLGHELLSARTRPGPFGGSFENRTRFLRLVVEGIRRSVPDLLIGVRFSAFDTVPFHAGPDGTGVPDEHPLPYPHAFGARPEDPLQLQLDDARQLLGLLRDLGIHLVNITAGSPYYNPHVQRPALFPPSDGYRPPEDPLVGVARQVQATARLKADFADLLMVGSAYTYLQEWLPHVAQHVVRTGGVDFVGIGRMVLSYPELPADVLAGRPLDRRRICRTFSACTTGPRMGIVSGCYPLDPFYGRRPEAEALKRRR